MSFYFPSKEILELKKIIACTKELPHEEIYGEEIVRYILFLATLGHYSVENGILYISKGLCANDQKYCSDEDCNRLSEDLKKELEIIFGLEAQVTFKRINTINDYKYSIPSLCEDPKAPMHVYQLFAGLKLE